MRQWWGVLREYFGGFDARLEQAATMFWRSNAIGGVWVVMGRPPMMRKRSWDAAEPAR